MGVEEETPRRPGSRRSVKRRIRTCKADPGPDMVVPARVLQTQHRVVNSQETRPILPDTLKRGVAVLPSDCWIKVLAFCPRRVRLVLPSARALWISYSPFVRPTMLSHLTQILPRWQNPVFLDLSRLRGAKNSVLWTVAASQPCLKVLGLQRWELYSVLPKWQVETLDLREATGRFDFIERYIDSWGVRSLLLGGSRMQLQKSVNWNGLKRLWVRIDNPQDCTQLPWLLNLSSLEELEVEAAFGIPEVEPQLPAVVQSCRLRRLLLTTVRDRCALPLIEAGLDSLEYLSCENVALLWHFKGQFKCLETLRLCNAKVETDSLVVFVEAQHQLRNIVFDNCVCVQRPRPLLPRQQSIKGRRVLSFVAHCCEPLDKWQLSEALVTLGTLAHDYRLTGVPPSPLMRPPHPAFQKKKDFIIQYSLFSSERDTSSSSDLVSL
eukprot:Protomagalhaensia_wolfi_Nauph_80__1154@NODE_1680_length_1401_cov_3_815712_g1304_i0_p1_GENE_NODE_1680_length_1401_cov_3_815712_g1304_i0NODE_1680_length_1401_cov_3_815712_g1304_i0_p1_ORF_typecomplete_len436_score58_37_NODE_1680_length_1401_cov_3_815712_g1304_i081315